MANDYRNTVFLPKTSFPMRANLPQREPEFLKVWKDQNLYLKMKETRQGRGKFILHDGPPYANGHIHLGTATNKVLKDLVNRMHHMAGKQINYIPGWDCHGLPIEWKIEEKYRKAGKNKDEIPVIEMRKECRAFAEHWMSVQSQEFQDLAIVGEWETPYSTMAFSSEAQIIKELGIFLMNGGLYRGEKPVLWSVVEKTALAEAEVEYEDKESPSIYVRFPIAKTQDPELRGAHVVIWTTTPWTLPGNRAIAYGKEFTYALIEITSVESASSFVRKGEILLIAQELVATLGHTAGFSYYVLKTLTGDELKGIVCAHPFAGQGYEFPVPLVSGDHVTIEAGTGFVHTAPGHGIEDFEVGKKYKLEVAKTVGPDGYFDAEVPLFGGQHVFKVNPNIIEVLIQTNKLFYQETITHSYPHSWRSKAPLIFRTTPQWFISLDKNNLRQKALNAIEEVQWIPTISQRRIESMVRNRPDWCISRQRAWGTPIPLFVHKKTGDLLRDERVHGRIVEAVVQEGADAWFISPPERFLAPEYNAEDYEQVKDVVDVWFDAGSTHAFTLEKRQDVQWPASLYLEGSDQHRGWFQASLLEACGTRDKAPYERVLTHGMVLDEHGRKMSKSLGNVIAPESIIKEMGREIFRLYVATVDYTQDIRIGQDILKHQQDVYRRFRNTLRYLIGGLSGYTTQEKIVYGRLPELERWVLHRLFELDTLRQQALKDYIFQNFFTALHNFCAVDLSAFYFDVRKDVLYCDAADNLKRCAMRTVLNHVFQCLTTWLAPVLCFTAEEAWQAHQHENQAFNIANSIHLKECPEIPFEWQDLGLAAQFERLRSIRRVLTGALEIARASGKIGSSLQAHLQIYDPLNKLDPEVDWAEFSITSSLSVHTKAAPKDAYQEESEPDLAVVVENAKGQKCQRCWKVLEEVGHQTTAPDLCHRCDQVVAEL